jgi:hypothetical protein
MSRWIAAGLLLGAVACGSADGGLAIKPGLSVGAVTIGMRFAELSSLYGPMPDAVVNNRFVIGGYPERGLDMILTSPEDAALTPEAKVIAVGARAGAKGATWSGTPRPGQTRAEIEAALGPAPDRVNAFEYWPEGVSVSFAPDGRALAVGVFAPYTRAPEPPEMTGPPTAGGGT